LNSLCRRLAAYKFGFRLRHRFRHIVSKDNPSDFDSRRWEPSAPVVVRSMKWGKNSISGVAPRAAGGAACPKAARRAGGSRIPGPAAVPLRIPLHRGRKVFIELFCGAAGLTASVRYVGLAAGPAFDTKRGHEFDLTRRSTQALMRLWVRSGCVWAIHFGTPCSIWSVARRNIKNMQRAASLERVGVCLALFTASLVAECRRCGVRFSIENPLSSKLWHFQPIADIFAWPGVFFVSWHMGAFDAPFRKPTGLLTDISSLSRLDGHHVPPDHVGQKLVGRERVEIEPGIFRTVARTSTAGAYPPSLCSLWAQCLREAAPAEAFGETPSFV